MGFLDKVNESDFSVWRRGIELSVLERLKGTFLVSFVGLGNQFSVLSGVK
jgi:hypothetical protein